MIVCRSTVPLLSATVRTFFKHFPSSPHTIKLKTLTLASTTAKALASSSFETLSPLQKDQVHRYVDALLHWNQRMNLTAVTAASEVMERHVEDSLAIAAPIRSSRRGALSDGLSVVDVGSGAGLPGLILAIACPGWEVTLMESMNKRCVFLEHVVGHIGLSNVRVVRGRAEDLGQSHLFREQFDVAVARAVAEMRVLAEYCLPLVRVGGLFVAAKGHNPEEEVKDAERAIEILGASILQICPVESHSPHGQRTAVICLKARPTPKRYPRDPGTPAKVPL